MITLSLESHNLADKIHLYPNPSSGNFFIEFENDIGLVELMIYDVAGKLIYSKNTVSNKLLSIDLTGNQRLYFYSIENEIGVLKRGKILIK